LSPERNILLQHHYISLIMKLNQPTTTTTVLICCVLFVTGLLIWSVNQTAGLKVETIISKARIEELSKEVAALHQRILDAKIESSATIRIIEPIEPLTGSLSEPASNVEKNSEDRQAELEKTASTSIQTGISQEGMLDDMAQPNQESSGVIEGNRALLTLNYNNAIENYTKVEADAADYINARMGAANAYFYSHQFDKAVDEFANVLKLEPDSVEAAIGLANAHQRLGQLPEQIAAYNTAISIEPEQWLHYNSRATAYLMNGDNEQAIEDYRQATRLAGPNKADQASALENIGLIHLREQQWELAFEHANEVNKLDIQHSWNWLIRGIAAAKLERNVDAYVSYDEWYKHKRSTDPYLLKQILPESIHAFIDVSSIGLTKLVDPPLTSGDLCANDSQCRSLTCRPGAPLNEVNYCVAEDKQCAAVDSNGYLTGETAVVDGIKVRCYQPESANARWTLDNRALN
jgi:tetratricopeptide (TPR) repeat protein